MSLDHIDRRIIGCLLENGGATNNEIADRVGLSAAPLSRRLMKLFTGGAIRRTIAIDPAAVGLSFQAFLQITLERSGAGVAEAFVSRVRTMPEVTECHMIAGEFDFLLKIAVRDVAEYKRLIWSEFDRADEIRSLRSLVLLDTTKARPSSLPADPGKAPQPGRKRAGSFIV